MPCHNLGSVIICTTPPSKFLDEEPVGVYWCFKCREHRMHNLHVQDPMSPWFDTEYRLRCDQCGDLAVDFNGECLDLKKWDDEIRAAFDRLTTDARLDARPKRTFFCLGCQTPEPTPGAFLEGKCPDCNLEEP